MSSDVHQFVPLKRIGNLILPKVSTDTLKLLNPNADALVLGSSTEEGGDIKVYRDASGNLQMSLDADAASNAKALDVYGGVVCQNYLTVGETTLNTAYTLRVHGNGYFSQLLDVYDIRMLGTDPVLSAASDINTLKFNIPVTTGTGTHAIHTQIDSNDIIVVQATGDGGGGVADKAIGLYGTTPATQAVAISDPAESIAANNAAIDSILAALRGIGLIATA